MSEINADTIKAAVKEGVREVLEALGMDVTTTAARIEVQKDLAHLRTLRLTGLAVANKALMVAVGVITTSALGAIWYVFQHGMK